MTDQQPGERPEERRDDPAAPPPPSPWQAPQGGQDPTAPTPPPAEEPPPAYQPPTYGAQPPQYGQPQYGQPQYGQPQYGHPGATGPKNDGTAIGALATGAGSLVFGLCCTPVGIIGGIVAIVLGFQARNRIAQAGGTLTGNGMAIAGMITGALAILVNIVGLALVLSGVVPGLGTFQP